MRAWVLFPVLAGALALGAALGGARTETPLDGWAEDAAVYARAALFGEDPLTEAAVVVALLDERSLASPRLKQLPRALMSPVWAETATKSLANGAVAVGFDFIMAFDARELEIGGQRPLGGYDNAFLRVLRSEGRAGRVVIGRSGAARPAQRFEALAGARGVAVAEVSQDASGVVRRMPPAMTATDGERMPTLSGAMLAAAGAPIAGPVAITPRGAFTTLPTISLADLLACDDAAALRRALEGRVVMVGGDFPGEDIHPGPDRLLPKVAHAPPAAPCDLVSTPVATPGRQGEIPGVYHHAAAVDAVLSGWAPRPAPPEADVTLAAAAALAATLAALMLPPAAAAAAAVALAGLSLVGGALALEWGWLIHAARPGYAALIAFAVGWAGKILFLDRRARMLRASFGRYVSPELVRRMLEQDRLPTVDGEQRHITVMFADLSGFTALSEKVDGKTLTEVVNRYLEIITAEVEASGGYVDKYIGDAVMALWNAPADLETHARDAALAAFRINAAVLAAAEEDKAAGLPAFSIKIGVNSGHAVVGNVGAKKRLNYTAVGDAVNIAARLEGLPSVLHTPIVFGPTPAQMAADRFAMLEIGSIKVKGRAEPVALFAPLCAVEDRPEAAFAAYDAALDAYRRGDFDAAMAGWTGLAGADWPGAALSGAMAGFARDAKATAPHEDWNGVIVMTSK